MSKQKYGYRDEAFYTKMRAAAWSEESLGVAVIFELTGMHVYSMMRLSPLSLKKEGDYHTLYWDRPKTYRTLNAPITGRDLIIVKNFLPMRRKSRTHYYDIVKKLGERAGFPECSPMTYRHQRCIWLLRHGYTVWEVPHVMGCTLDVVMKNYTKMKEWGEVE
jgi:hypothetical protein